MDSRDAKLALARKRLKEHQDKKLGSSPNPETCSENISSVHNTIEIPETFIPERNNNSHNYEVTQQSNIDMILNQEDNIIQPALQQNDPNNIYFQQNFQTKINDLEVELELLKMKSKVLSDDLVARDNEVDQYKASIAQIKSERDDLMDQLDFTKSILTAKENEMHSINSKQIFLENELDSAQLKLQQLSGGISKESSHAQDMEQKEALKLKVETLEHQLQVLQKERDQLSSHYEHYVAELNEQLKSTFVRNEHLTNEINILSSRENSLVEQISTMEIRLQNLQMNQDTLKCAPVDDTEIQELRQKNIEVEEQLKSILAQHEEVKQKLHLTEAKVREFEERPLVQCEHDQISLSKLNADIASDKVAAQRAAEQNKKLKTDIQDLEAAFIKMSQDKLELTEKLTAEKFLNRELTIKLADIDEQYKAVLVNLTAKDDEMMRLLSYCRDLEKKIPTDESKDDIPKDVADVCDQSHDHYHNHDHEGQHCHEHSHNESMHQHNNYDDTFSANEKAKHDTPCESHNHDDIHKHDAMNQLQERFLKIMSEVADLSDEKHRLEHIIMQLQNETDTICEYVALYQQQRSLLKKRDEERSAQIKFFQSECKRLRNQLDELSGIIMRMTENKEITTLLQSDFNHILDLLNNLKNNNLVNSDNNCSELKHFYPCACCSGKLIDV